MKPGKHCRFNSDDRRQGKDMEAGVGQCGFLLVEVMIAICILSIGVLSVCKMQITGLNGNTTSRRYTECGTIAMEQLD